MNGLSNDLKLDCFTILSLFAGCLIPLYQVLQVTSKLVVMSCPCTDFPLQKVRLYFPSHQLLFQRPCAFFFPPFHFGLYFPILRQCREEVKAIHLELGKKQNKKPSTKQQAYYSKQ